MAVSLIYYECVKAVPIWMGGVVKLEEIFTIKGSNHSEVIYVKLDGSEIVMQAGFHNQLCMQGYIELCTRSAVNILYKGKTDDR